MDDPYLIFQSRFAVGEFLKAFNVNGKTIIRLIPKFNERLHGHSPSHLKVLKMLSVSRGPVTAGQWEPVTNFQIGRSSHGPATHFSDSHKLKDDMRNVSQAIAKKAKTKDEPTTKKRKQNSESAVKTTETGPNSAVKVGFDEDGDGGKVLTKKKRSISS